jgi:hypothetical protein
MKKLILTTILTIIFMAQFPLLSNAQLEETYEAHGGLNTFKEFNVVEYDMKDLPFSPVGILNDHQLIDLNSRRILITSDTYKIGFDGSEAWITPNMEALGIPPRFYSSTPFYFFGLPFLFADPGVNLESLGTKEINGKEYNVVKVTYDKGIGDTPDDNYVAYIDKDTNQLKLSHYIVTYPPLMQGKSIDELERHAVVYDEWQEVEGLRVPKKISFYVWSDNTLGDSALGSIRFENVSFKKESPDPAIFQKPEGAVVDNSHKAQ